MDKEKTTVGLRYDSGKIRFDLIPPEWKFALAHLLTKGAVKYADRNWELGMKWSRVHASLERHLHAWLTGERYDKETGAHHLCAVAWNALVLMTYELRGIGEPDIPRNKMPEYSIDNSPTFDTLKEYGLMVKGLQ